MALLTPGEVDILAKNLTNLPAPGTMLCLIVEEISKVDGAVGVIVQDNGTGLRPFLLCDDLLLKEEVFSISVEKGGCIGFAVTEPNAGSDTASINTRAVRNNSNHVLNGRKTFVTNAGFSDYYVVFALTNAALRHRGMSAFLIDARAQELTVGKKENKLGLRASPPADVILEDVVVAEKYRIGEENNAFYLLMKILDATRPTIGAQALGIAEGAIAYAVNYATVREQFDRPIIDFQGLQFIMTDLVTQVEAARSILYRTTRRYDEDFKNISPFSSMTKLFCTDTAMRVTMDSVQIMGGYGCMKDHPLERMMRDAKMTQIYEGSNQIQRLVIAKSLKGDAYAFC